MSYLPFLLLCIVFSSIGCILSNRCQSCRRKLGTVPLTLVIAPCMVDFHCFLFCLCCSLSIVFAKFDYFEVCKLSIGLPLFGFSMMFIVSQALDDVRCIGTVSNCAGWHVNLLEVPELKACVCISTFLSVVSGDFIRISRLIISKFLSFLVLLSCS